MSPRAASLAVAACLAASHAAAAAPAAARAASDAQTPAALLVPAGPAGPLDPLPGAPAEPGSPPGHAAPVASIDVADTAAAGRVCEPGERQAPPPSSPPVGGSSLRCEDQGGGASSVRAGEAGSPGLPATLTASQQATLAFQMRSYVRQLHGRVAQAWAAPLAPPGAERRVALVTVVLDRGGRVVDARVDRPSHDEGFDRSALRTLRRPHLFPPLPPYYRTDLFEIGLRFADPARPASRR